MSRRVPLTFFLLVIATFCSAQDTRGALLPDTPVALMNGKTTAEDLDVGAEIWTLLPNGKSAPGKVTGVRRVHADSYVLLKAGKNELGATGSQRVLLADGNLVRLDTIKVGQKVFGWGVGKVDLTVTDVRIYPASLISYDLTIEDHRPFLAGGILVGD